MKRVFLALVILIFLSISNSAQAFDYWDQVNPPIIVQVADETPAAPSQQVAAAPKIIPPATASEEQSLSDEEQQQARPSAKEYEY